MLLPTPSQSVCLSVSLSFYESIIYFNLWVFLLELDSEEQDVRGKIRKTPTGVGTESQGLIPQTASSPGQIRLPLLSLCDLQVCACLVYMEVKGQCQVSIFYKTRSPVACPLSARQASPQASRNTGITDAYTMTLHLVFVCVLGLWTHILVLCSMHLPAESSSRPSSSSVS